MLSFEPLHASIEKMVFEILETPPGARRVAAQRRFLRLKANFAAKSGSCGPERTQGLENVSLLVVESYLLLILI